MGKRHSIANHSVLQNDEVSIIAISHQAITSFVSVGLFVLCAVSVARIAMGMAMDGASKFMAMSAVAIVLLCAFAYLLCVEAITRARATRRLLAARGRVKEKTK